VQREIGWGLIEPEHVAEVQVAIDRVNFERRHRHAVGVGDPRPFARPSVADARSRAAGEANQGRAPLAVQIEHQVVAGCADLPQHREQAGRGGPIASETRELPPVEQDHRIQGWVMPHEIGVLRPHEPIDARLRIARPQLGQQGRACTMSPTADVLTIRMRLKSRERSDDMALDPAARSA